MAHRKKPLTIREAVGQMSIAGEPGNVETVAVTIKAAISEGIDVENIPSVDNMLLALDVIQWDLQQWRRKIYQQQHPKRTNK